MANFDLDTHFTDYFTKNLLNELLRSEKLDILLKDMLKNTVFLLKIQLYTTNMKVIYLGR